MIKQPFIQHIKKLNQVKADTLTVLAAIQYTTKKERAIDFVVMFTEYVKTLDSGMFKGMPRPWIRERHKEMCENVIDNV